MVYLHWLTIVHVVYTIKATENTVECLKKQKRLQNVKIIILHGLLKRHLRNKKKRP